MAVVIVALTALACESSRAATRGLEEQTVAQPPLARVAPAIAAAVTLPGTARLRGPDGAPARCPQGMELVEGSYCPEVRHRCLEQLDVAGRYAGFRCARYAPTVECLRERRHLSFCIDIDEYTTPGASLPQNFRSYTDAKALCGEQGKRICLESEWNFACEGEAMRPYPYGFERDSAACNADQSELINAAGKLRDRRAPSDAYPRCVSPFGIRNLTGNLEEFVRRDDVRQEAPAMKGAYWQPGRNTCRAAQTAHDAYYNGMETGFRCCADPLASPTSGD